MALMSGKFPIVSDNIMTRPPCRIPCSKDSSVTRPVSRATSTIRGVYPKSSTACNCHKGAKADKMTPLSLGKSNALKAYFKAMAGLRKATTPSTEKNSREKDTRRCVISPGPIFSSTIQVRTASISLRRIVELYV